MQIQYSYNIVISSEGRQSPSRFPFLKMNTYLNEKTFGHEKYPIPLLLKSYKISKATPSPPTHLK